MQPQTQPPDPAGPDPEVVASLDELESLLKVNSPDRDFQPFWSENWAPPRPPDAPEFHGGTWASPIDLAEVFRTSAHDGAADTSMGDPPYTSEPADQAPDTPGRGGQDVPPDRS